MSPLSPKTITRLDPGVPLLWRDSETLQLGVDGDVRLPVDAPWVVPLLTRMAEGFRMNSFDVIAHGAGAPRREAQLLLARLRPLLVDDAPRTAVGVGRDHRDDRRPMRVPHARSARRRGSRTG